MSWRSVVALLLLAFAGGGAAFAWMNSDGGMPWAEPEPPLAAALEEVELAAAQNPSIPAATAIIQPSASQAEAQLLVLQARRAIEAGKPLGDLASRLQVTFGQSQPQALAIINNAMRKPISNAMLLSSFDAVAPTLAQPAGTAWDRARYEMAHLFVIRRGDARPTRLAARLARARSAIITGDVDTAVRTVRALPGAGRAKDWLVQAERALAVRQALDALNRSALLAPPPPPAAVAPAATPVAEPSQD